MYTAEQIMCHVMFNRLYNGGKGQGELVQLLCGSHFPSFWKQDKEEAAEEP